MFIAKVLLNEQGSVHWDNNLTKVERKEKTVYLYYVLILYGSLWF